MDNKSGEFMEGYEEQGN